MSKYYYINNIDVSKYWKPFFVEKIISNCNRIELIESYGLHSDRVVREIVKEKLKKPTKYFKNISPDLITVTMRPFLIKEENFSIVNSYELTDKICNYILMHWTKTIETELALDPFVAFNSEYPEFLYTLNNESIILLSNTELNLVERLGIDFNEFELNINDLIY